MRRGPSAEGKCGRLSQTSAFQADGSRALNRAWGPPEHAHEDSPAGREPVTATLPHWGLHNAHRRPRADEAAEGPGRLRGCPAASAARVPLEGPGASFPERAGISASPGGAWVPVETSSLDGCTEHQADGRPALPAPAPPPPPPWALRVGWVGMLPLGAAVQPGGFPFASVGSLWNVLAVAQEPALSEQAAFGTGAVRVLVLVSLSIEQRGWEHARG